MRLTRCLRIQPAALIFVLHGAALAAPPVIQSVNNAASNVTGAVAPQMIAAIFGQNLASSTASSSGVPLPTMLAGSSVTFNGIAAPLLYVSPKQINVQVPTGVQSSPQASIVVTTSDGPSNTVSVTVKSSAIGIFTQNTTGCGQLAAFNVHADGSLALNTPQNSLDPLSDWGLTIFLTGMGAFDGRIDGNPSPANPAYKSSVGTFLVNGAASAPLNYSYAGPAPGQVGVDQVNSMVYADSKASYAQGCKVPLWLNNYPVSASQYVNVSVRQGGGACTDSPAKSLGVVTWQKSVVSDAAQPSASDSVSMQFEQGPNVNLPSGSTFNSVQFGIPGADPSFCAEAYPQTLDAGPLTATGFGSSVTLMPQNSKGVISYQAPLLAGAIQGGSYTVTSPSGTASVGPFTAQAQIPPPIKLTNNLQPGTLVSPEILELDWTGGDSRSNVIVQYITRINGGVVFSVASSVSASANLRLFLLPFSVNPQPLALGDVEIIVTQSPAASPPVSSAPGLTLGVQQTWSYVFDYKGLTNH